MLCKLHLHIGSQSFQGNESVEKAYITSQIRCTKPKRIGVYGWVFLRFSKKCGHLRFCATGRLILKDITGYHKKNTQLERLLVHFKVGKRACW